MKQLAFLCLLAFPTFAEQGLLVVHIKDLRGHPVERLRIRAGDSSTTSVDSYGEARLKLQSQTNPGQDVVLEIVSAPKDYVFVSPWDGRVIVPSFANESHNLVSVVVAERGDRNCLENPSCIHAAAARIEKASAPKAISERRNIDEQRKEAMTVVAKSFGLPPEEIDRAIQAWGKNTEDPLDKGLAALYDKHYPDAEVQLSRSFEIHKAAEAEQREKATEAAYFLGMSRYQEGKYRESADAFREALQRRPDEGAIVNNLALALTNSGEYADAERFYRQAIVMAKNTYGPEGPGVGTAENNLALLLQIRGKYQLAEPLYRDALLITQKLQVSDDRDFASVLSNLAFLLYAEMRYREAEPLMRRALKIHRKSQDPDDLDVATDQNNLGGLLTELGAFKEAESLLSLARDVRKRVLGTSHPDFAASLNNLALLLMREGKYVDAEPVLTSALLINENALGRTHPLTAKSLENYAELREVSEHDHKGAMSLLSCAFQIDEVALGPDHPDTVEILSKLARAQIASGLYSDAEMSYRRLLNARARSTGRRSTQTANVMNALAVLLVSEGKYPEAEELLRQALEITTTTFGPNSPETKTVRANLQSLRRLRSAPTRKALEK